MRPKIIVFICFMFFSTLAFAQDYCFTQAGEEFNINPLILYAIAKVESNFNHTAINKNKNGTYDYGVMQINSRWYKALGHYNWSNLSDPCYNIRVGAWVLRQCMNKYGHSWDAVACYAAGNPKKGRWYTWRIYNVLKNVDDKSAKKEKIRLT
ncbi:MAG: lytic transglycosylase domain-containing protein, partial [candidate division WOR-3 bacterium]